MPSVQHRWHNGQQATGKQRLQTTTCQQHRQVGQQGDRRDAQYLHAPRPHQQCAPRGLIKGPCGIRYGSRVKQTGAMTVDSRSGGSLLQNALHPPLLVRPCGVANRQTDDQRRQQQHQQTAAEDRNSTTAKPRTRSTDRAGASCNADALARIHLGRSVGHNPLVTIEGSRSVHHARQLVTRATAPRCSRSRPTRPWAVP